MTSEANQKTIKQEFVPIPKYQRTWITPKVKQKKLKKSSALNYVMNNLDSIYAIDLSFPMKDLSLPEVYIKQLEVSCPFCNEERTQTLRRSQWLHMLEWTKESIENLSEITGVSCERKKRKHLTDLECALMDRLNDLLFNNQDSARGSIAYIIENHDHFYICEKDLEVFVPDQAIIQFPSAPHKNISICSQPNLAGTYLCSFCNRPFGVALFNKEGSGVLDNQTIIKTAISNYTSKKRPNERQSAEFENGRIALHIDDAHHDHTVELFTKTGLAKIDGIRFDGGNDVLVERLNHISASQLFRDGRFIRSLMGKLPPLPENVTRWANPHNLKLLILANRFVDYPAKFYETLLTDPVFYEIIDLQSGIPRFYSDIEAAYNMTGLPNKKSLRRTLFRDPLLLFKLLRADDLPFKNVDNLNKLLAHPDFDEILRSLGLSDNFFWEKGKHSIGWSELVKIKGENKIFALLSSSSLNDVRRISDCFRQSFLISSAESRAAIANTRMRDLPKVLPVVMWIENNPHDNIDTKYSYSEAQKNLESTIDGFSFRLPTCPRDYISAGIELHNCMGQIATYLPRTSHQTYILIKQDGKFVGGIMVEDMRAIKEAYAKCNTPLDREKGLKEAYIKWGKANNLTFEAFAI